MENKQKRNFIIAGFIIIGFLIGVFFTMDLNLIPNHYASSPNEAVVLGNQSQAPETILQLQNTAKAFTAVSKDVLPTVVSIATTKIVKRSSNNRGLAPLLKEFFGREFQFRMPEERRLQGLGSGVIVSKEGHIITNHHVIQNADDIKVTLNDNREFDATLVGTDPLTEIAVVKVDGDNLPVARLGDSENLEIGEWVLAFGNPLYLTSTVTAGIVSAKGRSIGIIRDQNATEEGGSYAIENFIQTDAAINPGNSGGALTNLNAEVIGINTAIASQTGGYQGYGFAVPINLARKIMNDLINQGYVSRAWLGISMRAVTETIAERFDLDRPKGVLINQVMEDSPAENAGLKSLDIILKIDDKKIDQTNEVQNTIALKNPGDTVTLTILRDGEQKEIRVKLGQRDTGKEENEDEEESYSELGLSVENLSPQISSQLNHDFYNRNEGVIVTNVERYSVAYDAGIRPGDFITRIEDIDISSVSDYEDAVDKFKQGDVLIFTVQRRNTEFHAFLKLQG
ncbi:Do family serine endopeptidase [candidate division KSB1 bacterium]|nr:Do family serine endopeptidase [candidate division KSB1 bacterium]